MKATDDRYNIVPGDCINIMRTNTKLPETCKVIGIRENGDWILDEYFSKYPDDGEYPFIRQYFWNLLSDYAIKNTIVTKIQDPETEGYKELRNYLSGMIEDRKTKLTNKYNALVSQIILHYLKTSEEISYRIFIDLFDVIQALSIYGINKSYKDLIPLDTSGLPFIHLLVDDREIIGKVVKFEVKNTKFVVNTSEGNFKTYSWDEVVPSTLPLQPSDFATNYPWNSVFANNECENLACRILRFTTSWENPLTWEEYYKTISRADKNVINWVKRDFDRLQKYLVSAETCKNFSPSWKSLSKFARKAEKV